MALNRHIILLGFKNTGKSTLAGKLAEHLHRPFFDLDKKIEADYMAQNGVKLNCRMIFAAHGEAFFRNRETQALKEVLAHAPAVIALGGGAPLRTENQNMIKPHWLVHVTADPKVVFTRIMSHGKPAYFPEDKDPWHFFQEIWEKHQKIYTSLTSFRVDNTASIEQTVTAISKEWDKVQ